MRATFHARFFVWVALLIALAMFSIAWGQETPSATALAVGYVSPINQNHFSNSDYDSGSAFCSVYDAVSSGITTEGLGSPLAKAKAASAYDLPAGASVGFVRTPRAPLLGKPEFLAANRALRLPATDTTLAGTRTLGYTTPNGNVFLQPGLSRAEQLSTLRHESVHAFLSASGSGPVATFRQNIGVWGYRNSQLLRFTEEAIAETYGSRSLLQGLRHPFVNGYVSPGGVLLEGGGLIGAGYLGYQLGTGN